MTWRRRPGRRRRTWSGSDRGSFTVELAAGLPALLLLLFAGMTAVAAVTTRAQCEAAAREGAVAAARGEPGEPAAARVAPAGAQLLVVPNAETVSVTVRADVRPLGRLLPQMIVEAVAVAAMEPSATEATAPAAPAAPGPL